MDLIICVALLSCMISCSQITLLWKASAAQGVTRACALSRLAALSDCWKIKAVRRDWKTSTIDWREIDYKTINVHICRGVKRQDFCCRCCLPSLLGDVLRVAGVIVTPQVASFSERSG